MVHWYKRDPDAAYVGMMCLTLEECGAYNRLIDSAYCRDGILANDDFFLARVVGTQERRWKRLKASLIRQGKIWIENEQIKIKRVADTISEAQTFSSVQRLRAKKRLKTEPAVSQGGNASTTTTTYKSSFGKESERLTISAELINHESKNRPVPAQGQPATALVGSAPSGLAGAMPQPPSEASQKRLPKKQASQMAAVPNPERPFSRDEVGKPNGWDWEPPRKKLSKMSLDELMAQPDDSQGKVA